MVQTPSSFPAGKKNAHLGTACGGTLGRFFWSGRASLTTHPFQTRSYRRAWKISLKTLERVERSDNFGVWGATDEEWRPSFLLHFKCRFR